MPTVFLFGAGASVAAGYPLARHLLDELAIWVASHPQDVQTVRSWKAFTDFRERARSSAPMLLDRLVNSPNPEVVLTAMDLFIEAIAADDEAISLAFDAALAELDHVPSDQLVTAYHDIEKQQDRAYNAAERESLRDAVYARSGFLRVLDRYFGYKHWEDSRPGREPGISALTRELESVVASDTVLTTNYDALLERVLIGRGDWTPTDGYGFAALLPQRSRAAPSIPNWVPTESRIRVLKLHGSYGWWTWTEQAAALAGPGAIYLAPGLLDFLPFRGPNTLSQEGKFAYVHEIGLPDPADAFQTARVMAYPSFVKQIPNGHMQDIWEFAGQALAAASSLKIIGYSLPRSDAAVRALLAPARRRALRGSLEVTVINPSEAAVNAWRDFFGTRVFHDFRNVGEKSRLGLPPLPRPVG